MDKLEYREKLEELTSYVNDKDYEKALPIVEEIDWKRVKSVKTLSMVADVYDAVKQYEDSQQILKLALTRSSIGRNVLSRLVEVSLKLGQLDEAEDYFDQFVKAAGDDNNRYLLQYRIFKAKKAPLDAQITVLEAYCEKEYTEKWAFELATLYDLSGKKDKCVAACDDLILWFGEGKYVMRAMDLKLKYSPLSSEQKKAYANKRNGEETESRSETRKTTKTENKVTETAKVSGEAEKNSAAQPNRTVNRDNLKKSIRSVFEGIREESAYASDIERDRDAEGQQMDNTMPLDMLSISDLEPEEVSETVITGTKNAETIVSMPKREKVKRAETSTKVKDFDLNALLAETAGVFSEAFKAGEFGKEEEEDKASESLAPTAEEVAQFKAAIKTVAGDEYVDELPAEEEEEAVAEPEEELPVKAVKKNRRSMDDRIAAILSSIEEPEKPEKKVIPVEETVAEAEPEVSAETVEELPVDASDYEEAAEGLFDSAEQFAEEKVDSEEVLSEKAAEEKPELIAAAKASGKKAMPQENAKAAKAAENVEKPAKAAAKPVLQGGYNMELEVPDPVETPKQKVAGSRTINLDKVGQNTVPISLDELLKVETPDERRIRILNKQRPTRMNDEQRKIFTYFARIPGMDSQILEAINGVYVHAGERTSSHGNIGVMGARGTGKSKLTENLVLTMCKDLQLTAAKVARIHGQNMNTKNPAEVVRKLSGGFLMIEDCSLMSEETVNALSLAMDFSTDCMILILEDEKAAMRAFLKKYPDFAKKIDTVINIPVFTNDELVTFARTYASENGCEMDDMGVLALYTIIGNKQSFEEPMTIAKVKTIMDGAIVNAKSGKGRRFGRKRKKNPNGLITIEEKDFENN